MNLEDVCYLSEIDSAIQGEGPLAGIRQIFVRFSACDLRCVWCDTPDSLVRSEYCEIEILSGKRKFEKIKNPVSLVALNSFISRLKPDLHHSISLTGGEPLLQYKFLINFLPVLKFKFNIPVYLETGGHRPFELKQIISFIDFLSMDFKLESSAHTGNLLKTHKEFLFNALSVNSLKNIWIKIVVTKDTLLEELKEAINLVNDLANKNADKIVEVILQPVTEINGSKPPDQLSLLEMQSTLLEVYPHIRVLPQIHKLMNQK